MPHFVGKGVDIVVAFGPAECAERSAAPPGTACETMRLDRRSCTPHIILPTGPAHSAWPTPKNPRNPFLGLQNRHLGFQNRPKMHFFRKKASQKPFLCAFVAGSCFFSLVESI